jgi:hypothetical protein
VGNLEKAPDLDYEVQKCEGDHGVRISPYLDASACHASSGCPSAALARARKHNYFMRAIVKAAQEAGVSFKCEPDTHALLLGEFTKADCKRLFPKQATKKYRKQFDDLLNVLTFVSSSTCTLEKQAKEDLVRKHLDLMPHLGPNDAVGLRCDLVLESQVTGEVKWIDVAGVHTTAPSYCENEMRNMVVKRRMAFMLANQRRLSEPLDVEPSPTVIIKEAAKREKYKRIMLVAKKQLSEGKRVVMPTFHPFIVSDCGELGPAAVQLQEWLVGCFRTKVMTADRFDGFKVNDLVRDFRKRFKLSVQLALASGLGGMILTAGHKRSVF